jgi:gas vesicle protein
MADELRDELESTETGSNRLAWFLTGAIIGAAVAVLYAPKSGKDTRQYITEKSRETLGDTGANFVETAKEMFDHGRQLVEDAADLFERGRKLVKG